MLLITTHLHTTTSYLLTSSDSLVLVHSTLGSHREAGLVPDSKVSISTNRQFYQLSDGAKSFESPALFSRVIASLLILVI